MFCFMQQSPLCFINNKSSAGRGQNAAFHVFYFTMSVYIPVKRHICIEPFSMKQQHPPVLHYMTLNNSHKTQHKDNHRFSRCCLPIYKHEHVLFDTESKSHFDTFVGVQSEERLVFAVKGRSADTKM